MKRLNLSANRRLPVLMELVNTMGHYTDPRQLIAAFSAAMRRAYGPMCFVQLSTDGLSDEYRIVRLATDDDLEYVEYHSPSMLIDLPTHRGGIFGHVIAGSGPQILHELDLDHDPVVGDRLAEYHCLMATPVSSNVGVDWGILLEPDPHAFRESDLEEFVLRANLISAMANNLDIAQKLAGANLQIQREIDAIGQIQTALLPEQLPQIPGLRLAASYQTFERAGGDLYDVAPMGERLGAGCAGDTRWAILIGDVSGHGPAAAVVMAMFHAILHTYPLRPSGPAEVLNHVNKHLCAKRIDQSFVTAFLAFYEPSTRELVYSCAGHNPPLLKDFPSSGPPKQLDAVGEIPLGIAPDVEYSEASVILRPGQTLVLYTDGITEARPHAGEMFGVEGIESALTACTGAPECAIRHINEALAAHQTDSRPTDDQTIVAVQVV